MPETPGTSEQDLAKQYDPVLAILEAMDRWYTGPERWIQGQASVDWRGARLHPSEIGPGFDGVKAMCISACITAVTVWARRGRGGTEAASVAWGLIGDACVTVSKELGATLGVRNPVVFNDRRSTNFYHIKRVIAEAIRLRTEGEGEKP